MDIEKDIEKEIDKLHVKLSDESTEEFIGWTYSHVYTPTCEGIAVLQNVFDKINKANDAKKASTDETMTVLRNLEIIKSEIDKLEARKEIATNILKAFAKDIGFENTLESWLNYIPIDEKEAEYLLKEKRG